MKKLFIAAVAVLGFGLAHAQEISYGVKAGLNMNSIRLSGEVTNGLSTENTFGFNVGGFAEIKFNDKLALQPELLYSVEGGKITGSYNDTSEEGSTIKFTDESVTKLGYINLPILLKYYATNELFFLAGPQVGFNLSNNVDTKETVTFMGQTISNSTSVDLKKDTETINFGLSVGAGYNFTQNIFAEVRYNLGLTQFNKPEQGNNGGTAKTGVFQVGLGYKF